MIVNRPALREIGLRFLGQYSYASSGQQIGPTAREESQEIIRRYTGQLQRRIFSSDPINPLKFPVNQTGELLREATSFCPDNHTRGEMLRELVPFIHGTRNRAEVFLVATADLPNQIEKWELAAEVLSSDFPAEMAKTCEVLTRDMSDPTEIGILIKSFNRHLSNPIRGSDYPVVRFWGEFLGRLAGRFERDQDKGKFLSLASQPVFVAIRSFEDQIRHYSCQAQLLRSALAEIKEPGRRAKIITAALSEIFSPQAVGTVLFGLIDPIGERDDSLIVLRQVTAASRDAAEIGLIIHHATEVLTDQQELRSFTDSVVAGRTDLSDEDIDYIHYFASGENQRRPRVRLSLFPTAYSMHLLEQPRDLPVHGFDSENNL